MILLAIILFLTVLEAVHEGLTLRYKILGNIPGWIPGIVEAIKLAGIVVLIPLIIYFTNNGWEIVSLWQYVLGWVLIRYAIFDPTHNLVAGLPIFYVGNTKLYDRLMQFPDSKWGNFFHGFTRIMAFVSGILFVLQADDSMEAAWIMTYIIGGIITLIVVGSFVSMIVGYIIRLFK